MCLIGSTATSSIAKLGATALLLLENLCHRGNPVFMVSEYLGMNLSAATNHWHTDNHILI